MTARAPSASALTTSLPRRIPPSSSTSICPPAASATPGSARIDAGVPSRLFPRSRYRTTAGTTWTAPRRHAGQRPDRRRGAVQVVPAVVRYRDRGGPDVDGTASIVGTHDALDHERGAPLLA